VVVYLRRLGSYAKKVRLILWHNKLVRFTMRMITARVLYLEIVIHKDVYVDVFQFTFYGIIS
jgi:hypothetical protein